MGIFDIFKRKKTVGTKDGPSVQYLLAHYALREFALENPSGFLATLASPDAKKFLEHILNSVCDQLNCLADFSPDSLVVHTVRVKNYPCTIIEMPDPNPESAEAYFVALVILLNPDEQPPNDPTLAPARYFTLERGVSVRIDDPPRTVLAEWSKDGHANFGDGPEPTVEHFAHSIVQLIS